MIVTQLFVMTHLLQHKTFHAKVTSLHSDDVTVILQLSPIGWLRDWSGDFSLSFIICGLFLFLGAIIILTLPGVLCRPRPDQSQTRNQSHQNHIPAAKESLMVTNGTNQSDQRAEPVENKGSADLPPHVISSSVHHLCLNTANMAEPTTGPCLENNSSSPCAVTSSHNMNSVL